MTSLQPYPGKQVDLHQWVNARFNAKMTGGLAIRTRPVAWVCVMGVACMQSDLIYYRQRQTAELAAAATAADPVVGAIHRELAGLYGKRIKSLESNRGSELYLVSAA